MLLACAFHKHLATTITGLFIVLDFTAALPKRIACLFALRQLTAFSRVCLLSRKMHTCTSERKNMLMFTISGQHGFLCL